MNRKLTLIASVVLAVGLLSVGCSSDNNDTPAENNTPTEQTQQTQQTVKELDGPIAEQPVLLTSAGQSADVEMVKVMLDKDEISYTINNLAKVEDIGDNKTLILAIGGSSKGLGAAGINSEEELARIDALIKEAQSKGLTIISAHIGGESRRGDLSDKFIDPCINASDYVLVVADGDKDGYITNLALKNDIPMTTVKSMADVISPLKAAFK